MHFSIFLLTLSPLAAWCSPNPQSGLSSTTTSITTSSSSSPSSTPSPTSLNPTLAGPAIPPPAKQEVIKTSFTNHENKTISATVGFKCNPTSSSPQLKDIEALSAHYLTKSTPPPITIPKGGANTCVPLEEKKDVSAAKLEACGNGAKLLYPEVGKLLQKFQGTCVRTIDGSQRVGGMMDFTAEGKIVLSIKVNKA